MLITPAFLSAFLAEETFSFQKELFMQEYQSQDISKLALALIQVQKDIPPAQKDAKNPTA